MDTLAAARKLLRGLKNKKLETLCAHYHYVNESAQSVDYEKLKKTWRGCRLQFHGRIDFGGNGGNHRRGNCFFFQ